MNNLIKLYLCLVFTSGLCFGQDSATFIVKPLSQIASEKERCVYVIELADSGLLAAGKPWKGVEKVFDLGLLTHEISNGKELVAHLIAQRDQSVLNSAGQVVATAFYGWYVVIELDRGNKIRKFHLSNTHK